MSEPKLISPLLDGFLMGSPMSDHNGVQCCPAMKENSDHKYIVKIISVPASQSQLDALLLAGAYKDAADAMDYFKELSDGIVKEAEFLKELSRLDGFLSFEGWQIVPMEKNMLGYQVYLLGSYKRSLEKHMRRTMLTHLDAVNLGLDLCSALATVRRAGYIYLDLKPSNIFLSEEKSYRIGDLGFAKLDSFAYTSLPGKYISQYTPPELHDPMSTLNDTVDTYALGMVLYRIHNDGNLPAATEDGEYPSPVNADYELAEIIMKAISPKVEDRWKDPAEMGQALVSYMQRNSVNDTPVTPQSTVIFDPQDVVKAQAASQPTSDEEEPADADETAPSPEDVQDLEDVALTEEVSAIVAHADDLISHETPEGVVIPEEPELPDPFVNFDPEDEEDSLDDDPELVPAEFPDEPEPPQKVKKPKKPKKPRKPMSKAWIGVLITLLILALLGAGGYYYYENFYLQTIDGITIEGTQSELTVTVDTAIDHDMLTVVCINTYGSTMTQPLTGGQAVFTDLAPDSLYRIQLEIEGFHKLVGKTSDIFTTEAQAQIVSFSSVTGAEDGSVQLNFTMDGPEPEEWVLIFSTQGEEERRETFSGHVITVKGLTVGKTYQFRVEDQKGNVIASPEQVMEFTASQLITAQNLYISAGSDSDLKVYWDTPEGTEVSGWVVRCYNDDGYEEVQNVTETEAHFTGVDSTKAYTVEVTADGMTQPARATITANPITITGFEVTGDSPMEMSISWQYEGNPPAEGWLLMYSVDGSDKENVIPCPDSSLLFDAGIPGAAYTFTVQAANGISIFDNVYHYNNPEAPAFNEHGLPADKITAKLVKTPAEEDWNAGSLTANDYRDTFVVGEPVSVVLHGSQNFYLPEEDISVLYIIRDGSGRVMPKLTAKETLVWKELWYAGDYHYGELDLPVVPGAAGSYSITIYFNGGYLVNVPFTITEE